MSESIKFLHTADVHLGRSLNPGRCEPPEEKIKLFQDAGEIALKRIVDLAIAEEVDFLLIAGDLHDRRARSVKASRFLQEQCRRLKKADISLYAISGNHDPGAGEREPFRLPDNVQIFSSEEVEMKEYRSDPPRVRILGQSYRSRAEPRKMYTCYSPPDNGGGSFNIGLLHTHLDPDNRRYVPVSLEELKEKNEIDYWALGHIHRPAVLCSSGPAVVYPGTPQPRTVLSGPGPGGCFLVEMDLGDPEAAPELKFAPISPVKFIRHKVDTEKSSISVQNLSDLERLLEKRASELLERVSSNELDFYGIENDSVSILSSQTERAEKSIYLKGNVVRWHIVGRGKIHKMVEDNKDETVEELIKSLNRRFAGSGSRPFLWTHSLMLDTAPRLPDESELKDNELYQEISSMLQEVQGDEKMEKELINSWGQVWQGDPQFEDRRPDRFYPDEETKEEILEAARRRIIAELFIDE